MKPTSGGGTVLGKRIDDETANAEMPLQAVTQEATIGKQSPFSDVMDAAASHANLCLLVSVIPGRVCRGAG
jgi:hypothetical protein